MNPLYKVNTVSNHEMIKKICIMDKNLNNDTFTYYNLKCNQTNIIKYYNISLNIKSINLYRYFNK